MENSLERINVVINKDIFYQCLDLFITKHTPDNKFYVGEIVWKEHKMRATMPKPTIQINPDYQEQFINKLMAELLNNNLIDKSEIKAINDAIIKTMSNHLDDMRKLVFKDSK